MEIKKVQNFNIFFVLILFFCFFSSAIANEEYTECETLADDPLNPESKTTGVTFSNMDYDLAIKECKKAIKKISKPQFHYNLARAYMTKALNSKASQFNEYGIEISQNLEISSNSNNQYYKLKFLEALSYFNLVDSDVKKTTQLLEEINEDYISDYESKNLLKGVITQNLFYETNDPEILKEAVGFFKKCIKNSEPNYIACYLVLSEMYIYDSDYRSEEKSLNYLTEKKNPILQAQLISDYYWDYIKISRGDRKSRIKQIESFLKNPKFDLGSENHYNPILFNKMFFSHLQNYPIFILGDYYLEEKEYEKSYNLFKEYLNSNSWNTKDFVNTDWDKGAYTFQDDILGAFTRAKCSLFFIEANNLHKKSPQKKNVQSFLTSFNIDWSKNNYFTESVVLECLRLFDNNYHGHVNYEVTFDIINTLNQDLPSNKNIMNWLGLMYSDGKGVKRSYSKAQELFEKAYELGDDYAANNIGFNYEEGANGREVDFDKAIFYYQESLKLSDNLNMLALTNLGRAKLNGMGIDKNVDEAIELFEQAVNLGDLEASYYLAKVFSEGIEKKIDISRAIKSIQLTINQPLYWEASTGDTSQRKKNELLLKNLLKKQKPPSQSYKHKKYAILIGNENYKYLEKLITPKRDIELVGEVLKNKFNYEVKFLINKNRNQLLSSLNKLAIELKNADKLLIYYAGHGMYVDKINTGFWLPIDAEMDNDVNWVDHSRIKNFITTVNVKSVLLLVDSCYSGTIMRGVNFNNNFEENQENIVDEKLKTRLVITSGGVEPVVDNVGTKNSVFALAVSNVLSEKEKISASQLFNRVKEITTKVLRKYSINQTPQYAPLITAGHTGGDFYLTRK
tara:strand:+ start:630 stop:3179 length:2550 start_codon:yes stop_codon:yes gene_type:complete